MYLVDTSVWIDFFRGRDNEAVSRFNEILDHGVAFGITGVIYQEVLQGSQSQKDFTRLSAYLATQRFYQALDPVQSYRSAAELYFRCRRRGVTVRSSTDCLVAQIAIEHRLVLLHNDQDFVLMGRVIKDLKLA